MQRPIACGALFFILFFTTLGICLLQVGERAPNFQLRDVQEKIVSLNWFCGEKLPPTQRKIVVLNFFQTTCKPCIEELPAIKRFYNSWKDDPRVIFFMIGCGDSIDRLKNFQQSQNAYNLPMLSDKYLVTCKNYGVTTFPATIVIDGTGIINLVIKERKLNLDEILADALKKILKDN